MSYNKSDGTRQYNKEERGGWYCTNPKKHEESHEHHGADEPHEHRAERHDSQPNREPEAKQTRTSKTFTFETMSGKRTDDTHLPTAEEMFKKMGDQKADPMEQLRSEADKRKSITVKSDGKKSGCWGCLKFLIFFWILQMVVTCVSICSDDDDETDDYNVSYDEVIEEVTDEDGDFSIIESAKEEMHNEMEERVEAANEAVEPQDETPAEEFQTEAE